MATITPTWVKLAHGVYVISWLGIATGDTIVAADTRGTLTDKSVEFVPTAAGGATLTVAGSNISATVLRGLNDPQGVAISVTAAALEAILENVRYIAPTIAGGVADNWAVHILCKGVMQKN